MAGPSNIKHDNHHHRASIASEHDSHYTRRTNDRPALVGGGPAAVEDVGTGFTEAILEIRRSMRLALSAYCKVSGIIWRDSLEDVQRNGNGEGVVVDDDGYAVGENGEEVYEYKDGDNELEKVK